MSKPEKIRPPKQLTRMQAERAISSGTLPPESFLDMNDPFKKPDAKQPSSTVNHKNRHVRSKAYFKMNCPQLSDPQQQAKLMADLHIKPKTEAVEAPAESPTT